MKLRAAIAETRRRLGILRAASIVGVLLVNPLSAQTLFQEDPIFDYAKNGDSGAVAYLLKKGTSVDSVDVSGNTVLSIGAGNGDLAMVELALKSGARVDREDKIGRTALFWAVESGNPEVVDALLEAGADINHQARDGLTPVMAAVRANQLAVLQRLLGNNPDLSVLDYTGRSALNWARNNRDRRAERMLRRAGAAE